MSSSKLDIDADNEDGQEYDIRFSTQVGHFDTFLRGLNELRDEGKLMVKEDGIFSKVVDSANVAMAVARMKGKSLNELDVTGDGPEMMALNFEDVRDFLKGTGTNNELQVSYPWANGGKNHVRLEIVEKDLVLNCPALDPSNVPEIPDTDPIHHKTIIEVDANSLKDGINNCGKALDDDSGALDFITEQKMFKIQTYDKVDGSAVKRFRQGGPGDDTHLDSHKTTVSYEYCDDISKVLSKGDTVKVHVEGDEPVRMDVDLDESGDAQVIYVIDPRLGDT